MIDKSNPSSPHDYLLDAWQRSVLFLDVLRQRGNTFRQRQEETAPHVLDFDADLVLDGRTLARPVNYLLVRIAPLPNVPADRAKRAFVVVDPRAGHGPGIGGMKADSEIGVALEDGHPCYFIGFLPEPIPDQTIEDVWNAEAEFIREVAKRHPDGGKPVVIGNCQAGWQTAIMAATHPAVPGPLLLAGAPLSYWAGVRGKNPLRYLGGVLGGTWLTSLAGDLGRGRFDGANLVANFEALDPANTYFDKPYNVYANVDTEAERFLDFEAWWGSPVLMNAGEMQWIADNLFIGNKLTSGELRTSEGLQIDLRNIQSPIIIFCSWGDNITPPQQALGWITDLYPSDRDLIANGQTIVYAIHETVGHLGIFVSGKIATREHDEFASAMDMIELMPPGLYEAVIDDLADDTANRGLVQGRYLFRLEPRTLEDIRKLVGKDPRDELKFAAVDRVSAVNGRLYATYARPIVGALTPPAFGDWAQKMHPNRLRFAIFSDENPAMRLVAESAEQIRKSRKPVAEDNPLAVAEKSLAKAIGGTLTAFGEARDAMTERMFHFTYGSPLIHALVGLDAESAAAAREPERDAAREKVQAGKRQQLEARFDKGGAVEAALRAIAFVLKGEGAADERSFAVIKSIHDAGIPGRSRSHAEFKKLLTDQSLLLRLDEERAIKAIPKLLPKSAGAKAKLLNAIQRVVGAQGELNAEGNRRLARVEKLFGPKATARKG
jgi:hypothetical protein